MDTFYVGAAEGTAWPFGLDDVETELQRRFPGIETGRGRTRVREVDYVLFDLASGDRDIECMYVDHFSLTMIDCEPEDCARILIWFLPLLPAGTPSVAMSDSHAVPVPLPPLTGVEEIAEFFSTLSPD